MRDTFFLFGRAGGAPIRLALPVVGKSAGHQLASPADLSTKVSYELG